MPFRVRSLAPLASAKFPRKWKIAVSADEKPNLADTFAFPALYRNLAEKAVLEQRNGLRQFEDVVQLVRDWRGTLQLTPDVIRDLHAAAIFDLYLCAGEFRTGPVEITGSLHTPPPHGEDPGLVADMCDYANANASRENCNDAVEGIVQRLP